MSANHNRPTAQVYDLRPAHLRRVLERTEPAATQPGQIIDDLADAVEAIHACANLAGFSERPRALLIALASAARTSGTGYVALFDKDLADLQGCATKTVQRQRADYLREARKLNFDLVEIIEGEFDQEAGTHKPTLYKFHVGAVIERIVIEARATAGWADLDRKRQRETIARAAARVYEEIPEAPVRRRKRRGTRPAVKEIKTCRTIINTNLAKLRTRLAELSSAEQARLLEGDGELVKWWLEVRAEMDALCNLNSAQASEHSQLEGDGGQVVHHPPVGDSSAAEPTSEAAALFDRVIERARAPAICRVEIELHATETLPSDEELEAEAIRVEACGGLQP